ncbi:MAG TPA: DinB family protein [Bryobacteraceae bacterium]|nr:DinB family protein [Bryobacteraceae bacterium]
MSFATNLAKLFRRDLSRMIQQIDAFRDDEMLWRLFPGATNSAGNLALHIEGNLREYIGRLIGGLPYQRTRELEFSSTGISKPELIARVEELREAIPSIIAGLSFETLEREYPQVVLEAPLSTHAFLVHLYGHLNWHLGQVDYLRRALSGDGAIERAGL